jgi:DNA-binding CsgD family transcriptional regulator
MLLFRLHLERSCYILGIPVLAKESHDRVVDWLFPMPWAPNPSLADHDELVSTIGEVYAAVENPALWPVVLDRIGELVESENVLLFANYDDSVAEDIHAMARTDPNIWGPYCEHYAAVNVWTRRCDRIFPSGSVRYSHRAVPDGELRKTEFYTDFLRPNGMAYGFGIEIVLPGKPPALLSALRSPRKGPFEARSGRILEALLPHLQRALRLHFEITLLRIANQGFELALDSFDRAVFGVAGKGKILFCNQAARHLVAEADGLRIEDNHLETELAAQSAELKFLLTQAATTGEGFSGTGAALIERKSGKPALRLTLMPFANNLLGHIPELATLVFVDDPTTKPLSRATALRALFHLSPTEARLTDLLASGADVGEASEVLGMSAETARFHLKSIFRKTGVNRQVKLVQLVLGLPGNDRSCA